MWMCFPERWLKEGNRIYTNKNAKNMAQKLNKMDSIKNCDISLPFKEPSAFRIPTSRERLVELAVVRLVKLTQASSKIKTASAPKIYTYWISPFVSSSYLVL